MYQKCVCFLFLVILAIFSCSGFRIDSLAMTDLTDTKKNSPPSLNIDRLFRLDRQPLRERRPQRIRHHRRKPHVDAFVYPPGEPRLLSDALREPGFAPTFFPSQRLAQIPPTELASVRSQRSPRRRKSRKSWLPKQPEDFFWKSYAADKVYLAVLKARKPNTPDCEVYFKVKHDYQGSKPGFPSPVDCHTLQSIYKTENLSKEFVLLQNDGEKTVTARLVDNNLDMNKFNKTRKPGFEPRKARNITVTEKHTSRKNRILVCKVEGGFPVPKITWRRKNGGDLHRKGHYRILYKRKKSKLIIKKSGAEFLGEYECVATSPDGKTVSKSFHLLPPRSSETIISTDSRECDDRYHEDYCLNDGKCLQDEMGERRCECPAGTTGERCQHKIPSDPSMYPQPELYSCKLGLSTKYNC